MNGNYIDKKEIKLIALIYKSKDCFDAKNLQRLLSVLEKPLIVKMH